ncbi:hypothetical protein HAX54_004875, partial [Datura stramonium]|nr:hypothetical protein [Datura stramonium]
VDLVVYDGMWWCANGEREKRECGGGLFSGGFPAKRRIGEKTAGFVVEIELCVVSPEKVGEWEIWWLGGVFRRRETNKEREMVSARPEKRKTVQWWLPRWSVIVVLAGSYGGEKERRPVVVPMRWLETREMKERRRVSGGSCVEGGKNEK